MPRTRNRPPEEHTYPAHYPPGAHWATDAAWEMLDMLVPGAISLENRALIAGMIAGRIMRERDRAARVAERAGASNIAEVIRKQL